MQAPRATFKRMEQSTRQDWACILPEAMAMAMAKSLPDRVLAHLKLLDGDHGGVPVDRLTHSLQTATLALKDGRDEEYVVCALWMVQNHGIFQGYNFFHHIGLDRNMRDMFKDHPHYDRAAEFVERYDNPAFDPAMDALPLRHFEPMLRRLMAAPKNSVYKAALPGE